MLDSQPVSSAARLRFDDAIVFNDALTATSRHDIDAYILMIFHGAFSRQKDDND